MKNLLPNRRKLLRAFPAGVALLAAGCAAVPGISDPSAVLAEGKISLEQRRLIYSRFWAPLNLNTATQQEIMLIPGMSARMASEFREYKPYKSINQFRFEIGKYVSKREVARYEMYVFVPAR